MNEVVPEDNINPELKLLLIQLDNYKYRLQSFRSDVRSLSEKLDLLASETECLQWQIDHFKEMGKFEV